MKVNDLDKAYWQGRYSLNQTGWDVGSITTPIKAYIDQLNDKNIKILIPGAGNSYEGNYLWQLGFKNIYVADIAEQPLINFKSKIRDFPKDQLINDDFFNLSGTYDLIIEQTFFCALNRDFRKDYVKKMYSLLKPEGKIVGLLFNFESIENKPPFGGNKKEYTSLFKDKFNIKILEKCYNSIEARKGKELFFIFEKNVS